MASRAMPSRRRTHGLGRRDPLAEFGNTSAAAVIGGGMWSVLGRVLPLMQLLVLSVVAARFLGPEGAGRQSFIAFVGLTALLVATAGVPGSLSRFTAELHGASAGGVAVGLYRWTGRFAALAAVAAAATLAATGLLGSEPALAW